MEPDYKRIRGKQALSGSNRAAENVKIQRKSMQANTENLIGNMLEIGDSLYAFSIK